MYLGTPLYLAVTLIFSYFTLQLCRKGGETLDDQEKSIPPEWDKHDPEAALEKAVQWVHDEVDRIRKERGLPPLGEIWKKPPCPGCDGTGFISLGNDADGYHWSRRCPWCNPDPPQGEAENAS